MTPCATHTSAVQYAVAKAALPAQDEPVAWLWARHGEAMVLAGSSLAEPFCPLCALGSKADSWLAHAIAKETA